MAMKLKLPDGCGSVGFRGVQYKPDADGCILIPNGVDCADLLNHGLEPVGIVEDLPEPELLRPDTGAPVQVDIHIMESAVESDEVKRIRLLVEARAMGLKPPPKTGIHKLEAMISEAKKRR